MNEMRGVQRLYQFIAVAEAWGAFALLGRRFAAAGQLAAIALGLWLCLMAIFQTFLPAIEPQKSTRRVAQAARAVSGPRGSIGVFDQAPLAAALSYYADVPVVELPSTDAVAEFFGADSRAVLVVRSRQASRVSPTGQLVTRARVRSGRREELVMIAAGRAAP